MKTDRNQISDIIDPHSYPEPHPNGGSERLSGHDYGPADPKGEKPVMAWPAGYWTEYEALRHEAREVCSDPRANMVVLQNGYFEVRYKNEKGEEISGPQAADRLPALTQFIDRFTKRTGKR